MTTPAEAATGPISLGRTSAAASGLENQAFDYAPGILSRPDSPVRPAAVGTRLRSLDVFRGITIAAMILVNNLGDPKYVPLEHADWDGWTLTDLIFPFFLFIVGVAIPFSFARRSTTTEKTRGQMLGRVWLRALSLFMLGELLAAFPMPSGDGMPAGYYGLKTLRLICFVLVWGGLIALLVPWKWRRVQMWVPIAVTVGFYVLLVAMHYANQHALAAGWPAKGFGGGIFNPDRFRIPGVLQRIGIVYGIVGTIALFAGWRTIVAAIVLLCAVYSALMLAAPYPGHVAGSLTKEDNLARFIDIAVFTRPHTYGPYPDNEGLLSTIPAIATSLLGILLGLWLRTSRSPIERAAGMLAMGVPVLILGCLLNWWLMPINKILWTPSYVFFTAGLATLCLGFLFWLIDVQGYRRWSFPAVVFGMNAIAAYVAAGVVPRLMNLIKLNEINSKGQIDRVGVYTIMHHRFTDSMQHLSDWFAQHNSSLAVIGRPENVTLANALLLVLIVWVLMLILYVLKIFVKV